MALIAVGLWGISLFLSSAVLLWALYRMSFAAAYLLRVRGRSPDPDTEPNTDTEPTPRFCVLVPAHDEELLIGASVDSLRAADYPAEALDIVVIAHNCRDATAEVARRHGARVVIRNALDDRGKGSALAFAVDDWQMGECDAVAIVDADVLVDRSFFRAMARELRRGGEILQAFDGISNPDTNTLTRLISVTTVMKNLFYNAGKDWLGFSPLLMGTGMVYRADVLRREKWVSTGLSECHEEGLRLIARGNRIRCVPDALVHAQEAVSLRQAWPQRKRWATGKHVIRRRALALLAKSVRGRNAHLAEACIGILAPTYSRLINLTILALAMTGLAFWAGARLWQLPLGFASASLALQVLEFGLALWIMGASGAVVKSIAFAPVFLVWKAVVDVVSSSRSRASVWQRTERHKH